MTEGNGKIDGPGDAEQKFPDLFVSYMVGINSMWANIPKSAKEARQEQTSTIEKILADCDTPQTSWDLQWCKANLLEQLIAPYLSVYQLKAEIARRLVEAENLKVSSAATFRAAFETLGRNEDQAPGYLPLYVTILDDLQWRYTKNRLDRRARLRAVSPILFHSVIFFVIAFAPFVLVLPIDAVARLGFGTLRAAHPEMGPVLSCIQSLYLAVSFGLLGALFSRLSSLQSNFMTLDYDLLNNLFKPRVVWMRLVFGMIGSTILYFAILGGLFGGDIFPNRESLTTLSYTNPDQQFAKLLVWSFLGGFSERLIPDFLQRTEAAASKSPA